jgi:hypothetical protein
MGSRVKGTADKILENFAERVLKLSRINLGRTYQATRPNGKKYRKRIDNSGTLKKSLDYDLKLRGEDGRFIAGTIVFEMADYGRFVDQGQKGTKSTYRESRKSPYKRRKQPPTSALEKWVGRKIKRFRDLETGSFVKMTDTKRRSLAYLIGRSIKHHGIEATHFFSDPLEVESRTLADTLTEAIGTDYANAIAQNFKP